MANSSLRLSATARIASTQARVEQSSSSKLGGRHMRMMRWDKMKSPRELIWDELHHVRATVDGLHYYGLIGPEPRKARGTTQDHSRRSELQLLMSTFRVELPTSSKFKYLPMSSGTCLQQQNVWVPRSSHHCQSWVAEHHMNSYPCPSSCIALPRFRLVDPELVDRGFSSWA